MIVDMVAHLPDQIFDKMCFRRLMPAFHDFHGSSAPLSGKPLNSFYGNLLNLQNMRLLQRKRPLRFKKSPDHIQTVIILSEALIRLDLSYPARFGIYILLVIPIAGRQG